eukprot:COSAG05_NODE_969_length_6392_cov_59.426506_5_plen_83_part_00
MLHRRKIFRHSLARARHAISVQQPRVQEHLHQHREAANRIEVASVAVLAVWFQVGYQRGVVTDAVACSTKSRAMASERATVS